MNDYTFPAIDQDTPLEEIKRIHRLIWDYCIEFGVKPKVPYTGQCVCCEYTLIHNGKYACENCPAIWPYISLDAMPCYPMYSLWRTANNTKHKRKFAEMIRDVPFKYEKVNEND